MGKEYELYDKVRVLATGDIGYIVDISKTKRMVIEKDSEYSDDKLIFDVLPDEIELLSE